MSGLRLFSAVRVATVSGTRADERERAVACEKEGSKGKREMMLRICFVAGNTLFTHSRVSTQSQRYS